MTKAEMRKMCAKMDADFKSQRPLPNGRNFRFWEHVETEDARERFRNNYDNIKWNNE